jgi:hypothetical protein
MATSSPRRACARLVAGRSGASLAANFHHLLGR